MDANYKIIRSFFNDKIFRSFFSAASIYIFFYEFGFFNIFNRIVNVNFEVVIIEKIFIKISYAILSSLVFFFFINYYPKEKSKLEFYDIYKHKIKALFEVYITIISFFVYLRNVKTEIEDGKENEHIEIIEEYYIDVFDLIKNKNYNYFKTRIKSEVNTFNPEFKCLNYMYEYDAQKKRRIPKNSTIRTTYSIIYYDFIANDRFIDELMGINFANEELREILLRLKSTLFYSSLNKLKERIFEPEIYLDQLVGDYYPFETALEVLHDLYEYIQLHEDENNFISMIFETDNRNNLGRIF